MAGGRPWGAKNRPPGERETTYQRRSRLGLCYRCGVDVSGSGRTRCPKCAETERAHSKKRQADGRTRDSKLRYTYGITLAEWTALFEAQGRRCAICGDDGAGTSKDWHTDHDHTTGRLRGILCNGCNTGLGHFKESALALERAARYVVIRGSAPERQVPLITSRIKEG